MQWYKLECQNCIEEIHNVNNCSDVYHKVDDGVTLKQYSVAYRARLLQTISATIINKSMLNMTDNTPVTTGNRWKSNK